MDTAIAPPPLPRRPRRSRWVVPVLIGAAVLGLALAILARRETPGAALGFKSAGGEDEFPRFRETWSHGSGTAKVVRIAVEGPIFRDGGGWFGPIDSIESVLRQVRAASNDPAVRGILLEVDSPGGAVTPCDEIHRALTRFREAGGRQVVVFVRDMAASGGYYIATAADWIVAEPTAIVGSIGVLMEAINWHELSRRLGIDATTVKSGDNKDLFNPFRPVDSNHVAIVQRLIDDSYARFRDLVARGRNLTEAEVKELADGSIFPAARAREEKLIDELGYFEDAVAAMARRLGVDQVRVVRYETRPSLLRMLMSAEATAWLRRLAGPPVPRQLMLWRP